MIDFSTLALVLGKSLPSQKKSPSGRSWIKPNSLAAFLLQSGKHAKRTFLSSKARSNTHTRAHTHTHTHTHARIDVFFHALVKVRFTRLFLEQQQEQQQQTTLRPRKEEKRSVIFIVLEDYHRGVQRYWYHQQQQQQEKQQKVRSNGGR